MSWNTHRVVQRLVALSGLALLHQIGQHDDESDEQYDGHGSESQDDISEAFELRYVNARRV